MNIKHLHAPVKKWQVFVMQRKLNQDYSFCTLNVIQYPITFKWGRKWNNIKHRLYFPAFTTAYKHAHTRIHLPQYTGPGHLIVLTCCLLHTHSIKSLVLLDNHCWVIAQFSYVLSLPSLVPCYNFQLFDPCSVNIF